MFSDRNRPRGRRVLGRILRAGRGGGRSSLKQLRGPTSPAPGPGVGEAPGAGVMCRLAAQSPRYPGAPGFVSPRVAMAPCPSQEENTKAPGCRGLSGLMTRPAAPTGHSSVPLWPQPRQSSWQPKGTKARPAPRAWMLLSRPGVWLVLGLAEASPTPQCWPQFPLWGSWSPHEHLSCDARAPTSWLGKVFGADGHSPVRRVPRRLWYRLSCYLPKVPNLQGLDTGFRVGGGTWEDHRSALGVVSPASHPSEPQFPHATGRPPRPGCSEGCPGGTLNPDTWGTGDPALPVPVAEPGCHPPSRPPRVGAHAGGDPGRAGRGQRVAGALARPCSLWGVKDLILS